MITWPHRRISISPITDFCTVKTWIWVRCSLHSFFDASKFAFTDANSASKTRLSQVYDRADLLSDETFSVHFLSLASFLRVLLVVRFISGIPIFSFIPYLTDVSDWVAFFSEHLYIKTFVGELFRIWIISICSSIETLIVSRSTKSSIFL